MKTKSLVKEAIEAYKFILRTDKQSSTIWEDRLRKKFRQLHWKTKSPGSDKFIAIKDNVVVKWMNGSGSYCDSHAITSEYLIAKKLKAKGLGKWAPKIYYYKAKRFIVEQKYRPLHNTRKDNRTMTRVHNTLDKHNIYIHDLHRMNIMMHGRVPKIIDGKLSS